MGYKSVLKIFSPTWKFSNRKSIAREAFKVNESQYKQSGVTPAKPIEKKYLVKIIIDTINWEKLFHWAKSIEKNILIKSIEKRFLIGSADHK